LKSSTDPGYNFAKGLFYQLSCKPTEAMSFYNKSRGDKKYGHSASIEMANICLNPDNEIRTDDDWKKKTLNQENQSSKIAQETAIKLLQTTDKPNDLRFKIVETYCNMHSGDKHSIEKALDSFIQLEANYKDNPSVLLGIAECNMLLKQVQKGRTYLKQAILLPWNSEDADALEKCNLLLASCYLTSGKYDSAMKMCKECLRHNKSCTKAYEIIGTIYEREQAYKDASDNYEKAWFYGNKNQPNIGYKLAFNHLKEKRYMDAIDICHYIIEKFPNFPKIKKEILDKARQSLRT
jgi:tetratricopeptide repeat protein 21B